MNMNGISLHVGTAAGRMLALRVSRIHAAIFIFSYKNRQMNQALAYVLLKDPPEIRSQTEASCEARLC